MFCCSAPPANKIPQEVVPSKDKPKSFRATFEKDTPKSGIGLNLDILEGAFIRIDEVHANGTSWGYNRGKPEDEKIKVGDYILSVNGVQGNGDVLEKELHSQKKVTLWIGRAEEFEVNLEKQKDQTFGMALKANETSLAVHGLTRGAAADWNKTHPSATIRISDRILSVNGAHANDVVSHIQNNDTVEFAMSRPFSTEAKKPFTATFNKKTGAMGIGMRLDLLDGAHMCIQEVTPNGPAWGYNRNRPEDEHIKVGDYILSVNGTQGYGNSLEHELHSHTEVTLEIARPKTWQAKLTKKPGEKGFGMGIKASEDGRTLAVGDISHGAVSDWNVKHPDMTIRAGDRIVRLLSTPNDMMASLEANTKVKCLMSRPPSL